VSEIPALLKAEIVEVPAGANPRRLLGGVQFGKVDGGAVEKHGIGSALIRAAPPCSRYVLNSQHASSDKLANGLAWARSPWFVTGDVFSRMVNPDVTSWHATNSQGMRGKMVALVARNWKMTSAIRSVLGVPSGAMRALPPRRA